MTKAKKGAQPGNSNAKKENRLWGDAIRRRIAQGKSLDSLAQALVDKALDGDIAALKEIGDRLDGKPSQTIEATVDASITVEITRFADSTT